MLVLFVLSKALEWSEVYRATSVVIYRVFFPISNTVYKMKKNLKHCN